MLFVFGAVWLYEATETELHGRIWVTAEAFAPHLLLVLSCLSDFNAFTRSTILSAIARTYGFSDLPANSIAD
jgi:hypothetical protein